jgi:hypothetical protein
MAKGTFKVGGMAHMAECLPSKHKVLSSNPKTTKKKKKKGVGEAYRQRLCRCDPI